MRKLCSGKILARRLQLPEHHPWLAACREYIVAQVADEEAQNEFEYLDVQREWDAGYRFNWQPQREHAEQLYKFPDKGDAARFVISSAYELFDRLGCPPAAIAIKVEKVERTGSWKTCEDYWLTIRIDGSYIESGTLDYGARRLLAKLEEEREAAKELRLDMEALSDL